MENERYINVDDSEEDEVNLHVNKTEDSIVEKSENNPGINNHHNFENINSLPDNMQKNITSNNY
jgi:hypothetical protein